MQVEGSSASLTGSSPHCGSAISPESTGLELMGVAGFYIRLLVEHGVST
jgi:hypothetical protein